MRQQLEHGWGTDSQLAYCESSVWLDLEGDISSIASYFCLFLAASTRLLSETAGCASR